MIELLEIQEVNDALAEMVALFRVELRLFKGIVSKLNIEAGRKEMEEYLTAKFPLYAALINGEYVGYAVCRIDSEVVGGIHLCQKRISPLRCCYCST